MTMLASTAAQTPIRRSAVAALAHGEIAGLDGLRALSVLSVMIGHFGFGTIVPGGLGVTVFFFISGFLITTLMLREARATGGVAIGRFYARRMLRLQPELWALIVISGIAGMAFRYSPTVLDWLGALFYVTNYAHVGAFSAGPLLEQRWPQLWSLAVEEHYYLTYPLLFAALMAAPRRLMVALVAVLVGALAVRWAYVAQGADTDFIYAVTQTRIDSIAYGCVGSLVLWYLPERAAAFAASNRTAIASFALVVIGASVALRNPMFRDTLRYSLQGAALMALVLSFYASSSTGIALRLLEWAPLKWMGRLSYGAYLWHLEVASGLQHLLRLAPQESPSFLAAIEAPIFCLMSFAVAWASFELFQRPVLALRHRFGAATRPAVTMELADGIHVDVMQQVQSEAVRVEIGRR